MKSEWREKKLVELASYKTGKLNSNAAEENGIYPFFTTAPTTYRINSWAFDQEAILLGGNNASGVFTLKMYSGKFNAYQRTYVIAVDETAPINNAYLYYSLKLQLGLLKDISIGSATKFLTKPILDNIVISYPSNYSQMLQIVECLSSLDSKIKLNNQMIATLEELAAILFKRWFVDFEFPDENGNPYKSSGGKMVDSELGEIPEGWEVGTLSDIGNIVGGGTPSKKILEYYEGGEIPWITPKDLSDQKNVFISKGKVSITPLGLQKSSAKMIPEKSILFSSRAPIGYIAISRQPVSTNQGFKSVVPKNSRWSVFIYLLLQYSVINIESRATGSTFKEISGTAMKNFPIITPTKLIIDEFSKTVNPIFHKIDYLEKEVRSLEKVKNILLPKLLSGEIEV